MDYEEHELVTRLNQRNSILYVPDAIVRHRISSDRMRWSYLRSLMYQRGFGSARQRVSGGEELPMLPRRLVRAARTGRAARTERKKNTALDAPDQNQARGEFEAYFEYGNQLGLLLVPYPRLTRWALGWLG